MSSVPDAETCSYRFDPSNETDAYIETTWECPHESHAESDNCIFHMSRAERRSLDVTDDDIVQTLRENLTSQDPRSNEYVGADLPTMSLTYQQIDGATNHLLNFQHADIAALDVTHGHIAQGINLREATIGSLKLDDAILSGILEATAVTITDEFSANETTFHEDVRFSQAQFHGRVDCDEATFDEDTSFRDASFTGETSFRNITARGSSHELDDHISFAGAHFESAALFNRAAVECATFADTQFDDDATFTHAIFGDDTTFATAEFRRSATFNEATFNEDATFSDVTVDGRANFRGTEFNGGARTVEDDIAFDNAHFRGDADFKLARFRYADFSETTFDGRLNLDRAEFEARVDCHDMHVLGDLCLDRAVFSDPVHTHDATFEGSVSAFETEFYGDADFVNATFGGPATFDEVRFHEDVSFKRATFKSEASFVGALFEGEAKSLEDNATFEEAVFETNATFREATFTNLSLWDTRFAVEVDFTGATVTGEVHIRLHALDDDIYMNFVRASISGGQIVEPGDSNIPFDFTEATVGNVQLGSENGSGELLDQFRFCRTDFDHFDFSDHHSYLERNDWVLHEFSGNNATGDFSVEMTPEVIEETYRKAMTSANDVGDTPASREFEYKRFHYNRRKNLSLIRDEYSLDATTKAKKGASVVLNRVMQFTCGYGNRLPRIAALTFLLPLVYGILYVLGGPLETGAGVVWNAEDQLAVIGNGIYYSYISFSTIGYGGIGPIGWGAKLLAASQGMLNGLLFTLLTFTLFKRVLGGS